jgi:hypothetical protein
MSKMKSFYHEKIMSKLSENVRRKTRVCDGTGAIIDELHPDWDYWHERHHEVLYARERCENTVLVKCQNCNGLGCEDCGNTGFQPEIVE